MSPIRGLDAWIERPDDDPVPREDEEEEWPPEPPDEEPGPEPYDPDEDGRVREEP